MFRSDRQDADEAFRAFVTLHRASLLRIALGLTLDPGHAEDLVQTALLRTYARWGRLRDQEPLLYVRRIVVNAHVDRWRRDKGRERLTADVPESSTVDETTRVADRDAVLRALAELPLKERRVVVLRFLADQSEADTAEQLGIPIGTVKSVTHRAIVRLRTSEHLTGQQEVTP